MNNRVTGTAGRVLLDRNLHIVFAITLMAVVGIFSIAPAFPKMVLDLGVSPSRIGLLISVFTIPGIFLMPVLGTLADLFGRKAVLVPCLALFAVAGTACFFARDFQSLLIFRFFQGAGAAPLSSINVAVIGDLFSGKERTAAVGYNQSVFSIGAAGMTALGGLLATVGWAYPFLLPIAALPVAYLVMFVLQSPNTKGNSTLKGYFGDVLITLRKRQLIGIYFSTIAAFIVITGAYLSFFPLLIGIQQGASPIIIGVIMSGMTFGSALSSACVGKIAGIISERHLMAFAFILYALALAIIPIIHRTWLFILPSALFGIAQGINLPAVQALLGGLSRMENRAIVMSFYGTSLRLGQTVGPLIAGALFGLYGMKGVFLVSACLAGLTSVFVIWTTK